VDFLAGLAKHDRLSFLEILGASDSEVPMIYNYIDDEPPWTSSHTFAHIIRLAAAQ
jgi:hypothetical protein